MNGDDVTHDAPSRQAVRMSLLRKSLEVMPFDCRAEWILVASVDVINLRGRRVNWRIKSSGYN